MHSVKALLAAAAVAASLAACSSAPPSLAGNWRSGDGTPTKVVSQNGACRGMYYDRGKPLDIGGGMSCSLSQSKDPNGRYSLVVSQPPNQATYTVAFDGNDKATVYDGSKAIYTMVRQ
ncbi:hypothetical protein GCM10027449_26560 [Sinomonas notoginsengisoli]|uniref:hypothetical protein n=1 Tax=Sinomonas notoginsengisoli TaxID=1457311 RepID=UPI001F32226D|nr:hypothetical protein [Sinomonas notoginsengisoli]